MKTITLASLAFVSAVMADPTLIEPPTLASRQMGSDGHERLPSVSPIPEQLRSQGCWSSSANLTKETITDRQGNELDPQNASVGNCFDTCWFLDQYVMALRGNDCLCGNVYPVEGDDVELETCNSECYGSGRDICGNSNDPRAWSVFNTGIEMDVQHYVRPQTTTTRPPTATSTTIDGSGEDQPTDAATESANPSNRPQPDDGDDGGPNVAAIAGGVVAGVVLIAAAAAGIWFHVRRRRNAEIEEEHRRNAAVNAFISGSKPPGSSGGNVSISDSRLEPGFAHRRLSDGSIADNQDYSRKILRVTNA